MIRPRIISAGRRFNSTVNNTVRFAHKSNTVINVCPKGTEMVVERLGKFHTKQGEGWFFAIPLVDRISHVHDTREQAIRIDPQPATTNDNVRVDIGGNVYIQIKDAHAASYMVNDIMYSVAQCAQAAMRSAIGKIDLDEAFHNRDIINRLVREALSEITPKWGCEVLRYEVTDIVPDRNILKAMDLQAAAERERRQTVKNAEAQKEATVLVSEAQRQKDVNESEGIRVRQVNEAQGEKEAAVLRAEGVAESLRIIGDQLETDAGKEAMKLRLAQEYIQTLGKLGNEGTTMFIPENMGDVQKMIASATSIVNHLKK